MRVTANYETTTYKGITIDLAKNPEEGWYVETSDGYTSVYFATKKEAAEKRAAIKDQIKKGYW